MSERTALGRLRGGLPSRPHRGHAAMGLVLAMLGSTACEGEVADARPQWVVQVATDAPVPQFGDRLLIELLDDQGESACSGCRRQFGIGRPEHWPISFGLLPPVAGGELRVRARLYRALDTGPEGLPGSDRIIDTLGVLPPADGVVPVALPLHMDCFGVEAVVDDELSCDPATGQLAPEPTLAAVPDEAGLPQVGSWPLAQPVPCSHEPPGDMICVPGGAFLLGSPTTTIDLSDRQPRPERLTVLSAFALDLDEVTVGQARQLVRDHGLPEPLQHDPNTEAWQHACKYLGPDDAANDQLPLNCVSHSLATQICEQQGKRLPTEAEWEYAAGNQGDESTFPWGADENVCRHSIVARGRLELDGTEVLTCRVIDGEDVDWGPVVGGHEHDLTELGIRNLGGNMAEWLMDRLNSYSSSCWEPEARILYDPLCDHGETSTHGLRGGSWSGLPMGAKVYVRNGSITDGPSPAVGLRCAQSM